MAGTGARRRFRRRRFLAGAAAGAAALALPAWLRPAGGGTGIAPALAAQPKPFRRRLPIPAVLTDATLEIPVKRARLGVLPGRRTEMWTYGGTFPGPTIRRPAGETTTVTFEHRLGRRAGELSVHLHGGHNTSADDGQPGGLTALQSSSLYCDISPGQSGRAAGNNLLIAPGGERTYRYGFTEDGSPERAAMHWYHDHRLDRTGENVWRGLAGMWITDDAVDAALALPRGDRDLPLLVCDRAFDRENQLRDPFAKLTPPDDGATGSHILVNGRVLPFHEVTAQRQRMRILNASNFRAYNLYLTGGVPVTRIASEAGLMPAPLPVLDGDRVLVGPGERVELVADFAAARGQRVELRSGRRAGGPDTLGSRAYDGALMEFRVGGEELDDETEVPGALRDLPAWAQGLAAPADDELDHTWQVTGGTLGRPWLINGRTFDPGYSDTRPKLGSVVYWKIVNGTGVAHMMHPHHTDWLMLSRNGDEPPAHERCLKETFFMDPFEEIVIAGKLSDHTGKYVLHCHMLDHEDHGLMSQFEVVDPAEAG